MKIRPKIKLMKFYFFKQFVFIQPQLSTTKEGQTGLICIWCPKSGQWVIWFSKNFYNGPKAPIKMKKKSLKIIGVLTTYSYVQTKFKNIWLKNIALKGLQKQRCCIRFSLASKNFRQVFQKFLQLPNLEIFPTETTSCN